MKKFSNQKGAISVITIVTMLFFLTFLATTYMFVTNKQQTESESIRRIRNLYASENAQEKFLSYFEVDFDKHILPSGYKEVEYIEGNGSSYINTGLKTQNKYQIEMKFKFTATNTQETWIIGDWKYGKGFLIGIYNGNFYMYCGNENTPNIKYSTVADTNIHTITINTDGVVFDGQLVAQTNFDDIADLNNRDMNLFKSNHVNHECGKCIFYCKIWDINNNLVRNFIPCVRESDNEPGLYDIENDVFYTNNGTGEFSYGNEVHHINNISPVIPIYTVEQLLKVGSNEIIKINEVGGKYYLFSENDIYIIMNDLEFDVDDYEHILGLGNDWTVFDDDEYNFDWNGHIIKITHINDVVKFYGNVKIADNTSRLPSEYTEVDYLESTGTQYIDSGVNLVDSIDIGFQCTTEYIQEVSLFGSRQYGSDYRFGLTLYANAFHGMMGTNGILFPSYDTNYHTLQMKASGGCYFDDTAFPDFVLSGSLSPVNLYLFAERSSGNMKIANARIFYCKLWKDDVLTRNFIPCIRKSDGKPGLYDTVNGEFYTNEGTGEFSYLRLNGLPSEYTEVDYLESTGTQYIDTGYSVTSGKEIELSCTWENVFDSNGNIVTVNGENKGWGGNINTSGTNGYGFNGGGRQSSSKISFWMGGNYTSNIAISSTNGKKYTDKITISTTGATNIQVIDKENEDILYNTNINRTYYSEARSIYLYKDNSNDPYPGVKKIYNFKVIENGICVLNLYPCYRNSDNEPGLYDTVTKEFYTNDGTGEFLYGYND